MPDKLKNKNDAYQRLIDDTSNPSERLKDLAKTLDLPERNNKADLKSLFLELDEESEEAGHTLGERMDGNRGAKEALGKKATKEKGTKEKATKEKGTKVKEAKKSTGKGCDESTKQNPPEVSLKGFHDRNNCPAGYETTFGVTYPYQTNYNDHFETPRIAYEHIVGFLEAVMKVAKITSRKDLKIYDPFYCQGSTVEILASMGFTNVYNTAEDCYPLLAEPDKLPDYDVLVTNPPYSGNHKAFILEFALTGRTQRKLLEPTGNKREFHRGKGRKPFAILIPVYSVNKQYWRRRLELSVPENRQGSMVRYLVPEKEYSYTHPDNTGHNTTPFVSCWLLGAGVLPNDKDYKHVLDFQRTRLVRFGEFDEGYGIRTFTSPEAIEESGLVSLEVRKNPRQRAKVKAAKSRRSQGIGAYEGKDSPSRRPRAEAFKVRVKRENREKQRRGAKPPIIRSDKK